jgi:ABC-type transporter Mla MlaB component
MTPFALNLNGSSLRLTLAGEITIQESGALAAELKNTLRPEHILEIDATQLTRLDAAGLQILLASAQVAADTRLWASSSAWTSAFIRYASPDPFRAP